MWHFNILETGRLYIMLITNKQQMGFCLKRKCSALTHYVFTYSYPLVGISFEDIKYLYNAYYQRNPIIIYAALH